MIESGRFVSLTELADTEKINRFHLCRILRLTLLAPEVVEAVLEGTSTAQLPEVIAVFSIRWDEQRRSFTRSRDRRR